MEREIVGLILISALPRISTTKTMASTTHHCIKQHKMYLPPYSRY